ncbi:hypothetical protein D8674_020255 [Pyrus ussuriensis x Pyrus communis]|uniref:Uncharacterized protein n=1 Tax=Pyrus ussuriensis x Pyrus communis TaxID=2448454 RepID=A0A5N5HII7_9ROSA|nr:hypothetical protein D8674_020255 [Pyrus ussuriensis x Pyrus communis]
MLTSKVADRRCAPLGTTNAILCEKGTNPYRFWVKLEEGSTGFEMRINMAPVPSSKAPRIER